MKVWVLLLILSLVPCVSADGESLIYSWTLVFETFHARDIKKLWRECQSETKEPLKHKTDQTSVSNYTCDFVTNSMKTWKGAEWEVGCKALAVLLLCYPSCQIVCVCMCVRVHIHSKIFIQMCHQSDSSVRLFHAHKWSETCFTVQTTDGDLKHSRIIQ